MLLTCPSRSMSPQRIAWRDVCTRSRGRCVMRHAAAARRDEHRRRRVPRSIAAATSSAMSRMAISPPFSSADTPSAIITAQYGHAVAIDARRLRQRLLDAHDVDARADRLLQPHARRRPRRSTSPSPGRGRTRAARRERRPAHDGARRVELAVVPPEVARLVIDDALASAAAAGSVPPRPAARSAACDAAPPTGRRTPDTRSSAS